MGIHSQSCWLHCSSCPSAAGCSCKAKTPLNGPINGPGKLSPGARFVCSFVIYSCLRISSDKDFWTQAKELHQDNFLYIFFKDVFVKKDFPDLSWIRESSPWRVSIPAARRLLGADENQNWHPAPPYTQRLPESPGYYLHWHGIFFGVCAERMNRCEFQFSVNTGTFSNFWAEHFPFRSGDKRGFQARN